MTTTLGYTIFNVASVEETLDFFTKAFGLERKLLTPEGDYGELETGSTTLAFVSNELAHDNLDGAGSFVELDPSAPPIAAGITLVTADPVAMAAQAIDCGATTYVPVADKPWGQTVLYLRDPNGLLVELATPITP